MASVKLIIFTISLICVSSERFDIKKTSGKGNFSFNDCYKHSRSSKPPIDIKYLHILPDPIQFGETITLSLSGTLDRDVGINHRIEVDFSLRLKTKNGYKELCDIIGEEACHYNDFCNVLKRFMENKDCPADLPFKNNCSCPFVKEQYAIPPLSFALPKLPFVLRGTFDMTINIHEQGTLLGCVEIHFCVTDCKPLGH